MKDLLSLAFALYSAKNSSWQPGSRSLASLGCAQRKTFINIQTSNYSPFCLFVFWERRDLPNSAQEISESLTNKLSFGGTIMLEDTRATLEWTGDHVVIRIEPVASACWALTWSSLLSNLLSPLKAMKRTREGGSCLLMLKLREFNIQQYSRRIRQEKNLWWFSKFESSFFLHEIITEPNYMTGTAVGIRGESWELIPNFLLSGNRHWIWGSQS